MNNVTINVEEVPPPIWSDNALKFALKVLDEITRENWELSILFCGDKKMTELNSQYRNKNEPTDILSFPLGETINDSGKNIYFPGDIVISLDTLTENSKYFNISADEELRRLIIHGILHLNGMDHKTTDSSEPMLALQEEILNKLKNERVMLSCGGEK